MLGKYKQGETWLEGAGDVQCPEVCRKKSFPVPAFAYPMRKRLTKKEPDPYEEDVDMQELRTCADETPDVRPPATY